MKLSDYLVFEDEKLEKAWNSNKVAMSELCEAYFDGKVDFKGDIQEFLENKDNYVKYSLFTKKHLAFLFRNFIPEVLIHSKKQDIRIGKEHYDRGNDFFGWFLGERMIYTSGFYRTGKESLEQAQDQKMQLLCDKMRFKEGDRHLDIGCGWGTLVKYTAKIKGAKSMGVTVAKEQVEFGNDRIRKAGLSDRAKLVEMDYRDIPKEKYDKITCLEMAEHVGVKNFKKFMAQIYDLLEDDGLFYLQIAGLRRGFHPEDLVWGLFMNKYIFPGADASTPLSWVLDKCEQVGFEIHSMENIGIHYSQTIQYWLDNWLKNEAEVKKVYGDRWYRIWKMFLAWSVQIAAQGSSTCFQIVMNKNLDKFDRTMWYGGAASELGEQQASLGDGKQGLTIAAPSGASDEQIAN